MTDGKPFVNPPHLEKVKSNEVLKYINVSNRTHKSRGGRNERQKKIKKERKRKKKEVS